MSPSFYEIGDIPFSNGKSLKELLIYEDISYWWCCKSTLLADLWKNDKANFGLLPKIHLYCARYFRTLENAVDKIANICVNLYIARAPGYNKTEGSKQKKKIVFRASTQRWVFSKTGKTVSIPYYDDIISQLSGSFIPEIVITDVPTPSVFRNYRVIYENYNAEVRASTSYYSKNIQEKITKSQIFFKDIWNHVISDENWFETVSSIVDLDTRTLKRKIEYFLLCTCPLSARYNYLTEEMINKEKPDGIILNGEQALIGAGWVFLAKKHHIPIIALQHGILLDDIKDNHYLQHKKEEVDPEMELQSYPLPDLTLVWGSVDYDMLVNRAYYPENRIQITGNPKYDMVPTYLSSKNEICQKYNIQVENKKIILWATQSHALSVDEALTYMHAVFSAVNSSSNLKLIIKPHPSEGENILRLYQGEQKKYPNLDVTYFTGTDNTSELISIADLVIVKNSTVGQEAIAFQKPLVVLDVSDIPDAGMFVKEGVATGVYNPDDLSLVICELLKDDTGSSAAREEYISKYLYKVDGLSAKRCVDCLLSLINQ